MNEQLPMLLLEADPLLRRTVAMTARTLGMADIIETGSAGIARRLLHERVLGGAVIALDFGDRKYDQYDLTLIDQIRDGYSASDPRIPIAVLLDHCHAVFLHELRARDVTRVILKPFRARLLLDAFSEFKA